MHIYTFTFTGNNGNGNRGIQKATTRKSLREVKELCQRTGATLISYF